MNEKKGLKQFDSLAALIVFGLFAACILLVLFSGAGVYSRLAARDKAVYSERTSAQYVSTRVRQAESPDSVSLTDFGGGQALCIAEETASGTCYTLVYCHNGYLRELYTADPENAGPNAGEKLIEIQNISYTLENDLLTAVITETDGTDTTVVLSLDKGVDAA